ncbi:Plasmid protein [compost metagenome]
MKNTFSAPMLLCLVSLGAAAQDVREHSDLRLLQQQITAIERLANRASSGSVDATGARYHFDYPRLAADLDLVRQGIHAYLSPSRAQPTDMVELTGDYRTEARQSSSPDEHD